MAIRNKDLIKEFVEDQHRRNKKQGNVYLANEILYSYGSHFPMMFHLGKYLLINGDRYSNSTSGHQSACNYAAGSRGVAVPFSALRAAGIPAYDVRFHLKEFQEGALEILDKQEPIWETKHGIDKDGKETTYQVHTLGASLIRYKAPEKTDSDMTRTVQKKRSWRYFLSGVDETGRGSRGSYFLTELKKAASTVNEAFEQLKPEAVKHYEQLGGILLRQGEYFFIERIPGHITKLQKQYALPDKDQRNSRHIATEGFKANGLNYVRGTIRHERKEHKMLKLGSKWHVAYANTQKASFNSGGGFD